MASKPSERAPRLIVGQLLGNRYRVSALLGEGGMGAVYRAFDCVLAEEVALKVVTDAGEGLRDEVTLAQQVTHPNVCRTYDLETVDGRKLVKMEYVPGKTLASELASGGALTVERTVAIVRAIADGLTAAHARGIVHRDLKPGNIMLDADRVVLMDFGLAQHEGTSDCAGTPPYMSPEQLACGRVDTRSDLFALGCVAFEMLVGAPPFGEGTIAQVAARQLASRPDVRIHRRVPRRIAAAVAALLSIDPDARARGLGMFRDKSRSFRCTAPSSRRPR